MFEKERTTKLLKILGFESFSVEDMEAALPSGTVLSLSGILSLCCVKEQSQPPSTFRSSSSEIQISSLLKSY